MPISEVNHSPNFPDVVSVGLSVLVKSSKTSSSRKRRIVGVGIVVRATVVVGEVVVVGVGLVVVVGLAFKTVSNFDSIRIKTSNNS